MASVNDDYIDFDNPEPKAGKKDFKKTKTLFGGPADDWKDKVFRITWETVRVAQRSHHEGPRYEISKNERAEKLDSQDRTAGAVVLPNPETKAFAVYRPVEAKGNIMRDKLRCLSFTGVCPACSTDKQKLDKKSKLLVKKPIKYYGANVFVWNTDTKGNLLGKNTKRAIDFCGRPILLSSDGTWDQRSYATPANANGEVEVVDEPTGEVYFLKFNDGLFSDVRNFKKQTEDAGEFTKLDFFIEVVDNFKNMKLNLASLIGLHQASAAFYFSDMLAAEFEASGVKNLGAFLCKEVTPVEMVYHFGLEQSLLPQDDADQGSLSDPETTVPPPVVEPPDLETAPVPPPPPAAKRAAPPPPPPPAVKAATPPPPPAVKAATPPPPPAVKAATPPPPPAAKAPPPPPAVKAATPPPPPAAKAPPPPPAVKAATPPPPPPAPKKAPPPPPKREAPPKPEPSTTKPVSANNLAEALEEL